MLEGGLVFRGGGVSGTAAEGFAGGLLGDKSSLEDGIAEITNLLEGFGGCPGVFFELG